MLNVNKFLCHTCAVSAKHRALRFAGVLSRALAPSLCFIHNSVTAHYIHLCPSTRAPIYASLIPQHLFDHRRYIACFFMCQSLTCILCIVPLQSEYISWPAWEICTANTMKFRPQASPLLGYPVFLASRIMTDERTSPMDTAGAPGPEKLKHCSVL